MIVSLLNKTVVSATRLRRASIKNIWLTPVVNFGVLVFAKMNSPGRPDSLSVRLAAYFVRRIWISGVGFGPSLNPITSASDAGLAKNASHACHTSTVRRTTMDAKKQQDGHHHPQLAKSQLTTHRQGQSTLLVAVQSNPHRFYGSVSNAPQFSSKTSALNLRQPHSLRLFFGKVLPVR